MLQLPLSLPQRIDPGASPRFAGVNLSGLAAAGLLAASLTGQLQAAESADVIAALGYTPTNAAVIPTGAPAAGQVLVGNAGGTAYARKTLTGDVTIDSDGVTAIGDARVVNSMLLNPAVTISGHSVALGASLALAQADVSGLTTASSPTFAGATFSALANAGILAAGTGGALRAATISDISFAAQANGLATLGGDGKLTGSQLPAIAITDTFVVNSQAAMLALTAQTGDIAIRTDISTTFVLSGTDPSILGNWTQVLFNAPVTSVAGRTGAVTLANTDVGLAFVTNDAQTKASVVPNTLPSAAQILIGNAGGTAYAPKSVSGDGGITSAGVLTVTKLDGVAPGPLFDATNANLLSGTLQAAQFPALTGDVTSSAGDLATTIAAGAVTLAKMANLPGDTFIGNATGSSAVPTALTSGQATGLLATFVGDAGAGGTKGLVPAPSAGDAAAFKYLAADGTWKVLAVPVTGVTVGTTLVSGGTNTRILYDNAGTLGEYTAAGAKTFLAIAATDVSGLSASATVDATNAANISSGTLPNARLSAVPNTALLNPSVTISGHVLALGASLALAYADISGLGTAAQASLSATNTQVVFNDSGALGGSAQLTFDKTNGQLVIIPSSPGSSRGTVVLNANALAVASLPAVAHHFAFRVVGPDNEWAASYIDNFGTISDGIGSFALRSVLDLRAMRGTAAVPAASATGDEFSRISCRGGTSSGFTGSVAAISAFAAENFTSSNQGAWLGFRTTQIGTAGGGDLVTPGLAGGVTSAGAILAGRGLFTSTLYACLINRDPGNGMFLAQSGYQVRGATDADYLTLQTAAGTGQPVIKLPFGSTDFTATGGTSQVVKQTSAGGALTVAQLTPTDVSLGSVTNDAQAKATNYPNGAQGQLEVTVVIDFSQANTDFALTVALPTGYTRWRFVNSFLNHASGSLSGGTFGVFPSASGAGTAIIASATSATVAVTSENTQNNMQNVAPVATATSTSYTYTTIYFRVQNVSSSAATCNFTLQYCPMS